MWDNSIAPPVHAKSEQAINRRYSTRAMRILTESNREQLPNFVQALKREGWIELQPFYQRRGRWDATRQSRLIESFIMGIPVPPLFFFEAELARYEVMDGQQRISSIQLFFADQLELTGLNHWPELNGFTYSTLPSEVRKGLDRRSISYIVMLKESAKTSDQELLLRQQVFERLNTGGVKLGRQEIRNCLFHGKFNKALIELSQDSNFCRAWGFPEQPEDKPSKSYEQMKDIELVLRFFALRHYNQLQSGIGPFLDLYMAKSRGFTDEDITTLKSLFTCTIQLACELYGNDVFRPWDDSGKTISSRPSMAFYDAVMIGLSERVGESAKLRSRSQQILDRTRRLFASHGRKTFTGAGNTKDDVANRIELYRSMIDGVL